MHNVVCRHCQATAPADAAQCPRCGQPLDAVETHVTAHPAAAQAIQADVQPEYQPASLPPAPEPPRGRYADWDDFRANSPVVQRTLLDLATRPLPDMRSMPRERLPADLPPAADALGVPLASVVLAQDGTSALQLTVQRIIALAVFSAVLLTLMFVRRHLSHFGLRGGLFIAVIALFLLLRFGLLRARPFLAVRFWLFDDGVLWQDGATVDACRFADIEDFRAMRDSAQPRFTLVPRPGVTLRLTLRNYTAILPLAEYIEIRMASAQLLPKLARIVAGERVRFGALVLDGRGIAGRGINAAWTDVVRVMGDGKLVYVECRDQPGWRSIRAGDVSCPMLLLSVAHILIEEAPRLPAPPIAG